MSGTRVRRLNITTHTRTRTLYFIQRGGATLESQFGEPLSYMKSLGFLCFAQPSPTVHYISVALVK